MLSVLGSRRADGPIGELVCSCVWAHILWALPQAPAVKSFCLPFVDQKSNVPKYGVSMVSVLGIVTVVLWDVLGIYFICGYCKQYQLWHGGTRLGLRCPAQRGHRIQTQQADEGATRKTASLDV